MILEGWKELTQEEIIENIRHGYSLMEAEAKLYAENPMLQYEREKVMTEAYQKFVEGKLPPIIIKPIYKTPSEIWHEMSKTFQNFAQPMINSLKRQWSIEELQKMVQKHPNRIDLKLELIKLQKENKSKFIGRPKRKKKK